MIEITYRPVDSLTGYARNSRTHSDAQIEQIARSIQEFGFTNPILTDQQGEVIAGHGRLMAAAKLEMKEVPCITLSHMTPEQKRAYILADNKLALNAGWDDELLRLELADLGELGFDLNLIGFDESELDKILGPDLRPLPGEDDVPSTPTNPVTQPGDIWILGNHRLLCGDATSIDAVDKLLDGGRANLCFTSPPYNLGKSVGLRNGARKGAESAYNDFQDDGEWADLMRGFLNNALMKCDVSCVNVQMLSGNKFDLLCLFGEYALNTIDLAIWSKTNPAPAMADGVMTSAFEFMWFVTGEERPNRRIKTSSFDRGSFSNVFSHATAAGHDASVHGAVFPLKVAEHYIINCSKSGDAVLDFFGGTGTTMIACEKAGRHARMIEIDPKYCDVIINRWQDLTGQSAVHHLTGKTFEKCE